MILQESIVGRLALLNKNVLYRGSATAFQEEAKVERLRSRDQNRTRTQYVPSLQ